MMSIRAWTRRRVAACAALVTLFATACPLCAQESPEPAPGDSTSVPAWPLGSEGSLRFFVDAVCFRGPEGFGLQEFYVLLDGKKLQFVPEASAFVAQIDLSITILDDLGEVVQSEAWTRDYAVDNLRELREAGGGIREVMGFSLRPGHYEVRIEVEDIYGDRKGVSSGTLDVADYEAPGLSGSDLLLATSVVPEAGQERFVRHGWVATPKVSRLYAQGSHVPIYHEIYRLSPPSEGGAGTFDVRYVITDAGGYPLSDPVDRRYRKVGDSAVLVDSVSVAGLVGGRYALQVTAIDRDTRSHFVQRATLLVHSGAGSGDEESEASATQLANLRYYRDVRYVASRQDQKVFEGLRSQDAKDKFLKTFWLKLDPTPGTPINERLVEHIRRMRHAENNFAGGHGETGIDSDKGRVYITYGPPSDREYRTAVDSAKPYEIWTYDLQGSYEFIFRDRRGIGVYELVHSTYPGELFNPDWQNEI